jgi:hypothetical protein
LPLFYIFPLYFFCFAGIDLFWVAVHEFGHNLGLGHSNIDAAVMAPFYRGYVADLQLHADDIAGIQAHYGQFSICPCFVQTRFFLKLLK